jgi:hypothetical protein
MSNTPRLDPIQTAGARTIVGRQPFKIPFKKMSKELSFDGNIKARRSFHVLRVEALPELSQVIAFGTSGFVLFMALDARPLLNSELRTAAWNLLNKGCAYVSVWGPDCERVHDQFDFERNPNEDLDRTVMTTWHDTETIKEAVEFSLACAWPTDGFSTAYRYWVGISLGSASWEKSIRESIATYNQSEP